MIKSVKAKNFRCFQSLELSDLRRINVVVGKNATGKTALLEVIRLALGGTPSVLFSMNAQRAFYNIFGQPPTREQFEAQWNPYFFNLDPTSVISTECSDSKGRDASVKVYYDFDRPVTSVPQASQAPTGLVATIVPVAFERTDFLGNRTTLYGSVLPTGGLNLEPGPEIGLVTEFFPSTWATNPQQTAQWFSQLSIQKRDEEIAKAVREEFDPLIESLSVLSPGAIPSVYASIKSLREKLPLTLISAGINKFVTVLAAILTRSGGVVLIDEIENGLYYKVLPSLWKTILRLAKTYDTQVFASTHSLESVRALLEPMEGNEEEFRLLRAERRNGSSLVASVEGRLLEGAIAQGFEVR